MAIQSEGISCRYRYSAGGEYLAVLKVIDNTELNNNWDADTIKIKVNSSPVANFNYLSCNSNWRRGEI